MRRRNVTRCRTSGQFVKATGQFGVSVRCRCGKLLKLTPKGRIPDHNRHETTAEMNARLSAPLLGEPR